MQDIYSPKLLPAIAAESPFPPLSCAVIDGALFTFPFFSFLFHPSEALDASFTIPTSESSCHLWYATSFFSISV